MFCIIGHNSWKPKFISKSDSCPNCNQEYTHYNDSYFIDLTEDQKDLLFAMSKAVTSYKYENPNKGE